MLNTPAPGRRNASVAAPYLQDGTTTTFPETVRLIARYQLDGQPASENISSIVQFLDSLTSEAGERVAVSQSHARSERETTLA